MENIIKDFSYNYDRIIQVLWKKGNHKKKIFTLKYYLVHYLLRRDEDFENFT
jgi:Zn-dependent peptidase ImmA (M78 family)